MFNQNKEQSPPELLSHKAEESVIAEFDLQIARVNPGPENKLPHTFISLALVFPGLQREWRSFCRQVSHFGS